MIEVAGCPELACSSVRCDHSMVGAFSRPKACFSISATNCDGCWPFSRDSLIPVMQTGIKAPSPFLSVFTTVPENRDFLFPGRKWLIPWRWLSRRGCKLLSPAVLGGPRPPWQLLLTWSRALLNSARIRATWFRSSVVWASAFSSILLPITIRYYFRYLFSGLPWLVVLCRNYCPLKAYVQSSKSVVSPL